MITRTFKLCLNAGSGSAPYINVNQYDEGETWLFELYTETGERYIPSSGAIIGIKSDGHGIANTGTVDSEGRVVITETEQMTAAAGRSIFELSIDGLTHGTANFIVNVEKKPIDGAIMSDSDLSLISQAVDSAAVIVDVIGDGDPSEVIGEHVDAWLDNHPEATTTVQDGAITAPKINQSLWDKLLVSEEASGAVASFDDGADDVPVSSLKVALEPIQTGSGDPSPTNIRPIVASNNINVWDEETESGYINTSNGQPVPDASKIRAKNFVPIMPNTTYYKSTPTMFWNSYYDANKNFISYSNATAGAFTTPANAYYMRWGFETSYGTVYKHDVSINYPSTYTAYQPYQGIMVDVVGKNLINVADITMQSEGYIFNQNLNLPTGQYVLSYASTAPTNRGAVAAVGHDGNNCSTTLSTQGNKIVCTINAPYGIASMRVYNGAASYSEIQLELGSIATDYEPFTSASYPYSLGQSVYGGSVDLATGVLTVTHVIVDMGSLTWNRTTSYAHPVFYVQINEKGAKYDGAMSSAFRNISSSSIGAAVTFANVSSDGDFACCANNAQIFVRCDQYTTPADFKTAVTGYTLVYPLTTPQTIQLTPQEVKTLLGYNNISSTGTVDVIYHADTKLYVDKMTAVDNNIIAPTEEDFVATRNYTVNDLVIVNDTLYKCTANIATGSAITPNSNVQQTTLGALIKALS